MEVRFQLYTQHILGGGGEVVGFRAVVDVVATRRKCPCSCRELNPGSPVLNLYLYR